MPRQLTSARRNYRLSRLISRRATREARKARSRGAAAVAAVVASHQIAQAQTSQNAVDDMLREQDIEALAEAMLNLASFTTDAVTFERMLEPVNTDFEFDRLVESIVTDAARAAESVATTVRPNIWHVRYVNPPCCARCAILAGRVYRWSDGFERHPGCDCSMIPTTVASTLRQDPDELVRTGQVYTTRTDKVTGRKTRAAGLSQADMQAFNDGADLGRIVNVHSKKAGLLEAGHALTRGGRPTPAGIYRMASDRDEALSLLARFGYIR